MGYMEKRKHQKRETAAISFLILILTIASFLPFLANLDWKFDLLGEFRFYYILISFLLVLYCLWVKKWLGAILALLIIIANSAIIYAYAGRPFNQNAKELDGETFSLLLYSPQAEQKNWNDLQNILSKENPAVALILKVKDEQKESFRQMNKSVYQMKDMQLGENNSTMIISSHPFSASGDLNDNHGAVAPWVTFNVSGRPISIVGADISEPWKGAKAYQKAKRTVLALAEFSKSRDEPTILAGNFSAASGSELLRPLSSLAELRALEGIQPVYPSFLPIFLRFTPDHVYTHPGIVVENVQRLSSASPKKIPLLLKIKVLKEQQ